MKQIIDSSKLERPMHPSPVAGRWFIASGVLGATLFVASLPSLERPLIVGSHRSTRVEPRIDLARVADPPARTPVDTRPAQATDESFTTYVAQKYAPLIEGAFHPSALTDAFYALLRERERTAVALNTSRQIADAASRESIPEQERELARHDERIRHLLHPTDYDAFEVLKDSDVEQFQLNDYADGIANVAPLDEASRRAVLLTKLAHQRNFRRALLDSGIFRTDTTPAARRAAFESVRQAFAQYTNGYLQEVRQYLRDDAQYTLLSNYERTEFEAELEKLRAMAYGD